MQQFESCKYNLHYFQGKLSTFFDVDGLISVFLIDF